MSKKEYKHVNYLWDDEVADQLDPVERLRYRSNMLGSDQRITNTGGGNTSSKIIVKDPLTGEDVDVMYVKGSGGDLRTSKRENFASLYMSKFLALKSQWDTSPDKGVKTELEDGMVAMYPHCVYNLNPRASSIDTPLHGLIPARHVDHTHPVSAIAIAASKDQEQLTKEVYGNEIGYVGWQRPGFDLGVVMGDAATANPQFKGLIMGQHGLINWDDDDKACYELSLDLIEKRFPDAEGVWPVPVAPEDFENGLPQSLEAVLDSRAKSLQFAESYYKQPGIPIGLFAKLVDENLLVTRSTLVQKPDLGIKCCLGIHQERMQAIEGCWKGS